MNKEQKQKQKKLDRACWIAWKNWKAEGKPYHIKVK
jgi:hypothetical protein